MASSKGFCISPGPKAPRSPPFLYELQSLRSRDALANVISPALILASHCWSSATAASLGTFAVDCPVRRDCGLREPECLMSRWEAWTALMLVAMADRSATLKRKKSKTAIVDAPSAPARALIPA